MDREHVWEWIRWHFFEEAEEEEEEKEEEEDEEEDWMDPWEPLLYNEGRAAVENGGYIEGLIVTSDSSAKDEVEEDEEEDMESV